MNGLTNVFVSIPVAASAFMEVVKYAIRWALQDPTYEFPMKFYAVMLPVAQVLVVPILAFAGLLESVPEHVDFSSLQATIATILVALIQSVLSVIVYGTAISPLKHEAKFRKLRNEIQEITNDTPSDQLEDIFNAQDE